MKVIDLIAYKIEAYDSDDFIKDLSSNGVSYLVLLFNPVSGYSIVSNVVENQKGKRKLLSGIVAKKNNWVFRTIFPLTFIIDYILVSRKISLLVRMYNPKNAFVDNTFIALHFARLRRKSKINNLIYASHDWFDGGKKSLSFSNFLKHCFSYLFLIFDYYVCGSSDVVLNHTKLVQENRESYWGRSIIRKLEYLYKPHLTPITSQQALSECENKNKIIFLGTATDSSGLELTLNAINGTDYELDIVGQLNKVVKNLIESNNINNFKYLGFCDRSIFNEIFSQSIVGINLITSGDVHTVHTIPSKVVDYLRHGVPVICTKNIGPFAEVIVEYNIGIIIDPDKDEILKALYCIKSNNNIFVENIKTFFEEYPFSNLIGYLELSK